MHDLTIGKVAPRALQSLLGLRVNFCPTPLRPTLNIDKSMERFERDLHIRSVFVGSEGKGGAKSEERRTKS